MRLHPNASRSELISALANLPKLSHLTSVYVAECKLADEDIAQATNALASTLETAGRGILYEHRPASVAASRLTSELKAMVDDVVKNAGSALERDAAIALRRIEQAAKMMSESATRSGASAGRSELQQLFERVLAPPSGTDAKEATPASAPSLIIP